MKSGSLVVRASTPWQHRVFHVSLFLLAIAAGFGLFYLGQYSAGFSMVEANDVQQQLKASIHKLEQNKTDLRDQLALVKRAAQVDGEAYQQVKSDLKSLQQEISELREEVSFYRGIVAPQESSMGMRIDRFDVEKSNEKNLYHYTLVLTQVIKNRRTTRGRATLTFEGVQNGRPKKLELPAVSVAKKKHLEFKFRFFQKIEGDIVLPKGFSPRQVVVEVSPHKKKVLKGKFEWPQLNKVSLSEMSKNG